MRQDVSAVKQYALSHFVWLSSKDMFYFLQQVTRVFIRHQRLENSPFTTRNSPGHVRQPMTTGTFYTNVKPFSKYMYSPVTLHLSLATRILNEKPGLLFYALKTLVKL